MGSAPKGRSGRKAPQAANSVSPRESRGHGNRRSLKLEAQAPCDSGRLRRLRLGRFELDRPRRHGRAGWRRGRHRSHERAGWWLSRHCVGRGARQSRHGWAGWRHGRHLPSLGAILLLFEVVGLQGHWSGRRSAIANHRDIRGPQFFQQKAARIARRGVQIARTRAEAETIEGRYRPNLIRADRRCRLVSQPEGRSGH